jgi:two-component system, OmpR family, response regulator
LCVVDLGLPDMDGIELMRKITTVSSSGVLILTGRGHTVDRVMGLELGADDYMVKPFEPRELVARVRSILRRRAGGGSGGAGGGYAPGHPRRHANFLGWSLDCAANILRAADGSEHLLGTAETQVLRAFVERPCQILTREQLIGQRDLSPQDRSIDVRISRLRRKLESDPQNPKIIKTVYGAGYMFSAAVTWT